MIGVEPIAGRPLFFRISELVASLINIGYLKALNLERANAMATVPNLDLIEIEDEFQYIKHRLEELGPLVDIVSQHKTVVGTPGHALRAVALMIDNIATVAEKAADKLKAERNSGRQA